MGGSSSKDEESAETIQHNKLQQADTISNDSGFHLMEIHIPSMGLMLLILLLLIAAGNAYKNRLKRSKRRQEEFLMRDLGYGLPNIHSFHPLQRQQLLQLQLLHQQRPLLPPVHLPRASVTETSDRGTQVTAPSPYDWNT